MKILYICDKNECQSILSEAITNNCNIGGWHAQSAGLNPVREIHPATIEQLKIRGIDTEGLAPKSLNDVKDFSPDMVITVSDICPQIFVPRWSKDTIFVHWGLPDPNDIPHNTQDEQYTFDFVIETLRQRINKLTMLDDENDRAVIKRTVENLAQSYVI